ncbi:hypothetical protein OD350_28635 (plasmid) [Clostridium beijerinckii]|uniref:hypothetical protein n=1 Tax=Clostridium beijerinckii TaxID=1520 RepID=UPI0022280174|nr:hypothetical protein [Clostridium beijerinckii]UYZ39041.1 hypothetical protein OD350_28635 [Clostridium beijerinckii]
MSIKINDVFYVSPEGEDICEYCGKIAELRPYGKNGANICYECGMKDTETTQEMLGKCAVGVKKVVISTGHNNPNEKKSINKEVLLPFGTHTIYITLDDDKIYKLNEDLSREEVQDIPQASRENPIVVMHKAQFDYAKGNKLNKFSDFKMSEEMAKIYNKIGFISDLELVKFLEY